MAELHRRRTPVGLWLFGGVIGGLLIALLQSSLVLALRGNNLGDILLGAFLFAWLWIPTIGVGVAAGLLAAIVDRLTTGRLGRTWADVAASAVMILTFLIFIAADGVLGRPGSELWWWVYPIVAVLGCCGALSSVSLARVFAGPSSRELTGSDDIDEL